MTGLSILNQPKPHYLRFQNIYTRSNRIILSPHCYSFSNNILNENLSSKTPSGVMKKANKYKLQRKRKRKRKLNNSNAMIQIPSGDQPMNEELTS
jgi:hypothetical protein